MIEIKIPNGITYLYEKSDEFCPMCGKQSLYYDCKSTLYVEKYLCIMCNCAVDMDIYEPLNYQEFIINKIKENLQKEFKI